MHLLLLLLPMVMGHNGFKLTKVEGPIIKEKLADAYLYNEIWTTIHFFELKDITTDVNHMRHHRGQLVRSCNQHQSCSNLGTTRTLQARFAKLDLQYTTLIQIANGQKRGLINAFGTGMKYLFGTINADDIEEINSSIDKVHFLHCYVKIHFQIT